MYIVLVDLVTIHLTGDRLAYLNPRWFDDRDVLDIGCNIGHVTLTVARDFNTRSVIGVDIDKKLINIANKNIKHYVYKEKESNRKERDPVYPKNFEKLYKGIPEKCLNTIVHLKMDGYKPHSFELDEKNSMRKLRKYFPYNVKFRQVCINTHHSLDL